jgi:hypothetical protein
MNSEFARRDYGNEYKDIHEISPNVLFVSILRKFDPAIGYSRWPFLFASAPDLRMVAPSPSWGVRRAGLRLKGDRLLYPPNLMRVMPP